MESGELDQAVLFNLGVADSWRRDMKTNPWVPCPRGVSQKGLGNCLAIQAVIGEGGNRLHPCDAHGGESH